MELGAVGHGGPLDHGPGGLGQDRIGSPWTRHLLPVTAFPLVANPKKALNAQEFQAFSQVPGELNRAVASS